MNCLNNTTVGDVPCCVLLLDGRELSVQITTDEKLLVLFRRVCDMLALADDSYFGFRYATPDSIQVWLSLKKPLLAQLSNLAYPIRIYFGVKFYPADPCKISDVNIRYQIYLQVRNDVQTGILSAHSELLAELCALALQSEIGDYNPRTCKPNYISEFQFLRAQNSDLETRIAQVHKLLRGIVPETAEFIYLDKAKWLEAYGVFLYPTLSDVIGVGVSPFGCVTLKRDLSNRTTSASSASVQPGTNTTLQGAGAGTGAPSSNRLSQHFWSRVTDCKYKERVVLVKTTDRENSEYTHQFVMRDKVVAKACCAHAREYLDFFRRTHSSAANVADAHSRRSSSASRRRHHAAGSSLTIEDGLNFDPSAPDTRQEAAVGAQPRRAMMESGARDLLLRTAASSGNGAESASNMQAERESNGSSKKARGFVLSDDVDSDADDVHIPGVYDRKVTEQEFIERMQRKLERHAARTRTTAHVSASSSAWSVRQSLADPASVLSHFRFEPIDPAATGWSAEDVRAIPYTQVQSTGDADAAWLAQRRRVAQKYYQHAHRHGNPIRYPGASQQQNQHNQRAALTESSGDETTISRTSTRSEPAARRMAALALNPANNLNQHGHMATSVSSGVPRQDPTRADLDAAEREYAAHMRARQDAPPKAQNAMQNQLWPRTRPGTIANNENLHGESGGEQRALPARPAPTGLVSPSRTLRPPRLVTEI